MTSQPRWRSSVFSISAPFRYGIVYQMRSSLRYDGVAMDSSLRGERKPSKASAPCVGCARGTSRKAKGMKSWKYFFFEHARGVDLVEDAAVGIRVERLVEPGVLELVVGYRALPPHVADLVDGVGLGEAVQRQRQPACGPGGEHRVLHAVRVGSGRRVHDGQARPGVGPEPGSVQPERLLGAGEIAVLERGVVR